MNTDGLRFDYSKEGFVPGKTDTLTISVTPEPLVFKLNIELSMTEAEARTFIDNWKLSQNPVTIAICANLTNLLP